MYTADPDIAIFIQLTTIKIKQQLNNRSIVTGNRNNIEMFLDI